MSLENPNNKEPYSEDITKEVNLFVEEKDPVKDITNEIFPINFDYTNEIIDQKEKLFPEGIKKEYQKNINLLNAEIKKIVQQIGAREQLDDLASLEEALSESQDTTPLSELTTADLLKENQKYDRFFDLLKRYGTSTETVEELKEKQQVLFEKYYTLIQTRDIARNNPRSN